LDKGGTGLMGVFSRIDAGLVYRTSIEITWLKREFTWLDQLSLNDVGTVLV
jgi:hypothetical protein